MDERYDGLGEARPTIVLVTHSIWELLDHAELHYMHNRESIMQSDDRELAVNTLVKFIHVSNYGNMIDFARTHVPSVANFLFITNTRHLPDDLWIKVMSARMSGSDPTGYSKLLAWTNDFDYVKLANWGFHYCYPVHDGISWPGMAHMLGTPPDKISGFREWCSKHNVDPVSHLATGLPRFI